MNDKAGEKNAVSGRQSVEEDLAEKLMKFSTKKDSVRTLPADDFGRLTRLSSRAVMRNLCTEIKEQLNLLHGMLKNLLQTSSDAAINWLLDTAEGSRGGFVNVQSLRNFFSRDPQTLSSSRLITAIDTLTTCIAYRVINAHWAPGPTVPDDSIPDAKRLYELLRSQFLVALVPCIYDDSYNAMTFDTVNDVERSKKDNMLEVSPLEVLSDASDVEDEREKQPRTRLDKEVFRVKIDVSRDEMSWPAAAHKGGVAIRGHVSGTTPLALAVVNHLYEINKNTWSQHDDNLRKLAGALLVPSYERGDYHSVAEVACGVEYYLQAKKGEKPCLLSPQKSLMLGMSYMTSAAKDEGSLKQTLQGVSSYLMEHTKDLPFLANVGYEDLIRIIKNTDDLELSQKAVKKTISLLLSEEENFVSKCEELISAAIENAEKNGIWAVDFFLETSLDADSKSQLDLLVDKIKSFSCGDVTSMFSRGGYVNSSKKAVLEFFQSCSALQDLKKNELK